MTSRFIFSPPPLGSTDPWVTVGGGGLEHPLEIKVAVQGGRPFVTGIRIDSDREITARSLRGIRLRDIATELVQWVTDTAASLDPTPEALDAARSYEGPLSHDWTNEASQYLTIWESAAMAHELRTWLADLSDADTGALQDAPRGRGARPATEDELRAFAKVYLEERLNGKRGAKPRTAERVHMTRPTVYRWIERCVELGILPELEDESEEAR